jgi:hypothetical protein
MPYLAFGRSSAKFIPGFSSIYYSAPAKRKKDYSLVVTKKGGTPHKGMKNAIERKRVFCLKRYENFELL